MEERREWKNLEGAKSGATCNMEKTWNEKTKKKQSDIVSQNNEICVRP